MNCKRTRELLLTDYLDKQTGLELRTEVEEHLKICPECRRLEAEIRRAIVLPFKDAKGPQAPHYLWLNIKERIAERESSKRSLWNWLRERLQVFTLPAPALTFASTMVILLAVFGLIAKQNMDKNQISDYFSQQISFYSVLNNGLENGDNKESADLGTTVEKYLF
jgi:predicted anti-sigma-YlaC factor YlaD